MKGNPDTRTQGAYDGLTVWEQIDAGTPWFVLVMIIFSYLLVVAYVYYQDSNQESFDARSDTNVFVCLSV